MDIGINFTIFFHIGTENNNQYEQQFREWWKGELYSSNEGKNEGYTVHFQNKISQETSHELSSGTLQLNEDEN